MRLDHESGWPKNRLQAHGRKAAGNSFSAPQAEQVTTSAITRWFGPMLAAMTEPQLPHW
jgi:hypothetical protein